MYHNSILGRQGGILKNGGNGTKNKNNVPVQYRINLAEPNVNSVGTLRGASASAAPIIAVNKERFDNRSSKKAYMNKVSNENLTYALDFRDSLRKVSGGETISKGNVISSGVDIYPRDKVRPIPTQASPIHMSMPLFIQACINMNYGMDNVLYDNTSKSLKFSTPSNGLIVPERHELFGLLLDDLHRIENGQFPVHPEWYDSFGSKMVPSKAKKLASLLNRISSLIQFTKENNTWLGKGCNHMRSIMNALLTDHLLDPRKYKKQAYYTFFYHLTEQAYDDHQGRAIRGEPKPSPLKNAELPPLPFPAAYVIDVLYKFRRESEATRQDLLAQAELARRTAAFSTALTARLNVRNNAKDARAAILAHQPARAARIAAADAAALAGLPAAYPAPPPIAGAGGGAGGGGGGKATHAARKAAYDARVAAAAAAAPAPAPAPAPPVPAIAPVTAGVIAAATGGAAGTITAAATATLHTAGIAPLAPAVPTGSIGMPSTPPSTFGSKRVMAPGGTPPGPSTSSSPASPSSSTASPSKYSFETMPVDEIIRRLVNKISPDRLIAGTNKLRPEDARVVDSLARLSIPDVEAKRSMLYLLNAILKDPENKQTEINLYNNLVNDHVKDKAAKDNLIFNL